MKVFGISSFNRKVVQNKKQSVASTNVFEEGRRQYEALSQKEQYKLELHEHARRILNKKYPMNYSSPKDPVHKYVALKQSILETIRSAKVKFKI